MSVAIPATFYGKIGPGAGRVDLRLTTRGPVASLPSMAAPSFVVACPCCGAKLTLDPELRAVIAHEDPPPRRAVGDLGAAFDKLRSKSAEREAVFRQEMESQGQKGRLLDRKFQEGLKKAKDSPDPPRRPFDAD